MLANPNRILDDEVRDTFRLAPLATAELSLPPAAPGAAPSKTPALRFTADTHSSQPREDNGGARMHTADAHSERSESDGGESGGGGGAGGGGGGEGEVIGAI